MALNSIEAKAQPNFDFSQNRGKTDLFSEENGWKSINSPIFEKQPFMLTLSSSVFLSKGSREYIKSNNKINEIDKFYNKPVVGNNSTVLGVSGDSFSLFYYNISEFFGNVSNPVFPEIKIVSTKTKIISVSKNTNRFNGVSIGSSISIKKMESEFLGLDAFDAINKIPEKVKSEAFALGLNLTGSYLVKSPNFLGELRIRFNPELWDIKNADLEFGTTSIGSKFSLIPNKLNLLNITTQIDYSNKDRKISDIGGALEYESPGSLKLSLGSNLSGLTAGVMSSFYGISLKFGSHVPGTGTQDRHIRENELRFLKDKERLYSLGISVSL